LTKLTPETTPPDWAMVQNNLGNALVARGERDRRPVGESHLIEAITVFQAALNVRIRAEMPLSWAMTQNNLGNAFSVLGERKKESSGDRHLEAAIAAYNEALKEYTINRVSLARDRAMTQNNLGVALTLLGEREKSAGRLAEAVAVLRTSLEQRQKLARRAAHSEESKCALPSRRIEADSARAAAPGGSCNGLSRCDRTLRQASEPLKWP
jgi:tetratricopeptide (TPR) repeat protein